MSTSQNITNSRLFETQDAFDSVAADYDGPRGNNDLIQDMRRHMWTWLDNTFKPGSNVIDLGCGTGLDAVRMAEVGNAVTATDWSPKMVARTRDRAEHAGLTASVKAYTIGSHELDLLEGEGNYDGAYSNLGPLNCVPDLTAVSKECARLLKPGGKLVFTVIGRLCPWEIAHYGGQGKWERMKIRFSQNTVAVGMNKHTVWTRYYWPKEFYRCFQKEFSLVTHRGLCVFAPPPYLTWVRNQYPRLHKALWRMDSALAGLPSIRAVGDHFLIVMSKR